MRKIRAPERILEVSRRHTSGRIIYDMPEFPGKVLRRQNIASRAGELAVSPAKLLDTAEYHFAQLREFGINIPDFTNYLNLPGWRSRMNPRRADLYALVDHITGRRLELDPNLGRPYAVTTIESLTSYYQWVQETSQAFQLFDISDPRQYMLGHVDASAQDTLYMPDVEPDLAQVLAHVRAGRGTTDYLWRTAMRGIQKWKELQED